MILINACVGLGASIYAMTLSENIMPFTLLFLAMVIAISYLVRRPFRLSKSENRYLDALFRAAESLNKILQNKMLFRKLFLNNIFLATVMGVTFIYCLQKRLILILKFCIVIFSQPYPLLSALFQCFKVTSDQEN